MGVAVHRVGDVDRPAVEQADELGVEAGRAVLAALQARDSWDQQGVMVPSARCACLDQLNGLVRVRHELLHGGARLGHQVGNDPRHRGLGSCICGAINPVVR